ncbi:MAG: HAMP domain-containing protein [Candidatus Solibacter usitatus]|nr:HAMP domain-containing protein [Candidatus Solibacter usitatus]
MRSLYAKILLWLLLTAAFSLLGVLATSFLISRERPGREDTLSRVRDWEIHEAIRVLQSEGPDGLGRLLSRMNDFLPGERRLLSAQGQDMVTGEDLSDLVAFARKPRFPWQTAGPIVFLYSSADGRFLWLVEHVPAFQPLSLTPYYLWIAGAIALFSALLAYRLVRPLRALSHAARRLGHGDLAFRVPANRRDEIGELEREFNTMAERIQQLVGAERRLLQDVSHELRSPLARLRFAVELATADQASKDRIKKEVDRLAELVDMLLEVSRAEAEDVPVNLSPVALHDLLREIVDSCRLEAEGRGCRLEVHVDEATVNGNRELLRRAVENLVRNAIRYAPPGSAVEVSLHQSGKGSRIVVRDHGPGVPEEQLARIFDPFFRVEQHRNRTTGGVGLGLSIAQRAVRVHGGTIQAENAAPGLRVSILLG